MEKSACNIYMKDHKMFVDRLSGEEILFRGAELFGKVKVKFQKYMVVETYDHTEYKGETLSIYY